MQQKKEMELKKHSDPDQQGVTQPGHKAWDSDFVRAKFLPEENLVYHEIANMPESALGDISYVLKELATLPVELQELLQVLEDQNSSAAQVGEICEKSVAISTMVLKLVNSPAFGLFGKVDDLTQAIKYIGFNELRSLVLGMHTYNRYFKAAEVKDIRALWEHSIASSKLGTWVASNTNISMRNGMMGTGGMLRGIGKVFLMRWRPEKYKLAVKLSAEEGITLMEAENRAAGMTHAFVGGLMAEYWNLSGKIQYIIKGCNLPELDYKFPELAAIHLSGQIARTELGFSDGEPPSDNIPEKICKFLNLEYRTVSELCARKSFMDFISLHIPDAQLKKADAEGEIE